MEARSDHERATNFDHVIVMGYMIKLLNSLTLPF